MKEETRPRSLATEQTSLCSSHSCLPNLPRTTEFPETIKIGKQAAYQLTGAPCTQTDSLKITWQAPLSSRVACTIPWPSGGPLGRRQRSCLHPSISVFWLQSEALGRAKPCPASHAEQKASLFLPIHPAPPAELAPTLAL